MPGISRYERFIGTLLCGGVGNILGSPHQHKTYEDIMKTDINQYKIIANTSYTSALELTLILTQYLSKLDFKKSYTTDGSTLSNREMVDDIHFLYSKTVQASTRYYSSESKNILLSHPLSYPGVLNTSDSISKVSPLALLYYSSNTELYNFVKNIMYYTHGGNKDSVDVSYIHVKILQTLIFDRRKTAEDLYPYVLYLTQIQRNKHLHTLLLAISPDNKNNFIKNEWNIPKSIFGYEFYQNEAVDCFICALTCFLYNFTNPYKAMLAALTCGGNTDTITKLVGEYTGALYGFRWLPPEWLTSPFEDKTILINLAAGLYIKYPRNLHGWKFTSTHTPEGCTHPSGGRQQWPPAIVGTAEGGGREEVTTETSRWRADQPVMSQIDSTQNIIESSNIFLEHPNSIEDETGPVNPTSTEVESNQNLSSTEPIITKIVNDESLLSAPVGTAEDSATKREAFGGRAPEGISGVSDDEYQPQGFRHIVSQQTVAPAVLPSNAPRLMVAASRPPLVNIDEPFGSGRENPSDRPSPADRGFTPVGGREAATVYGGDCGWITTLGDGGFGSTNRHEGVNINSSLLSYNIGQTPDEISYFHKPPPPYHVAISQQSALRGPYVSENVDHQYPDSYRQKDTAFGGGRGAATHSAALENIPDSYVNEIIKEFELNNINQTLLGHAINTSVVLYH